MAIRARRKSSSQDIPPAFLAVLRGEPIPADVGSWEGFLAKGDPFARYGGGYLSVQEYWQRYGPEIMEEWLHTRPGTRPGGWWTFDAPRWDHPDISAIRAPEYEAPRLRLVDGEAVEPVWPNSWYSPVMVHGLLLHPDIATDVLVETEAHYLRRHGLLTPDEARRLGRGAPDFEPFPQVEKDCFHGWVRPAHAITH